MATGCLSVATVPDFAGLTDYSGERYHTGSWPQQDVYLAGKRVAVIGTGSSGVQVITTIAPEVGTLHVFQRTPAFSVPARNHALTAEDNLGAYADRDGYLLSRQTQLRTGLGDLFVGDDVLAIGATPGKALDEASRQEALQARYLHGGGHFIFAYADLVVDREMNEVAADYLRDRIEEIVEDPDTARLLMPTDNPVGTKRICCDTGYYEVFNQPNVTLVDTRANPIERITTNGLRAGGTDYEFDVIIFATGYDAMTGALARIDIRGRDGRALSEEWRDGPLTYLGLAVSGFPSLFMITGPQSPSVLSNMVASIEQHVDWISACLSSAGTDGTIEAKPEAQAQWVAQTEEVAAATLFPTTASWYMGANVPGKPRNFMAYVGGMGPYREICDSVARSGYERFSVNTVP